MPKIVELLGPSGIGKSSVYQALQRRWELSYTWGVYHDIRYKRKPRRAFPADYIAAIQRRIEKNKQEIQYENLEQGSIPNERSFYHAYPEFSNTVVELVDKHNRKGYAGEDRRFLNLYFFMETAEHYQAIRQRKNDPRTCLMDEAFISRLMHLNSPSFGEQDLNRYLNLMPLPWGVIYLDCDAETVVHRISRREKTATLHEKLTREDLLRVTRSTQQWMEKSLERVQKKGVDVFVIDASRPVEEITNRVVEILEQKSSGA